VDGGVELNDWFAGRGIVVVVDLNLDLDGKDNK
jgi:septal ring factor EnvC (AmiA/AmiB activator)